MGESVDQKYEDERNERLTNLALANAHIMLALIRLDDYYAYHLFHELETSIQANGTVELNVSIANMLETAGIGQNDVENIWEMLETREGKRSIRELFKSSEVVRSLTTKYRYDTWKVMAKERPSKWLSIVPATYLYPVLTISEVNRVLDFLENGTKLNPELMGLVVNMNSELSREEIRATFEYVRDQLMHQTNAEVRT